MTSDIFQACEQGDAVILRSLLDQAPGLVDARGTCMYAILLIPQTSRE